MKLIKRTCRPFHNGERLEGDETIYEYLVYASAPPTRDNQEEMMRIGYNYEVSDDLNARAYYLKIKPTNEEALALISNWDKELIPQLEGEIYVFTRDLRKFNLLSEYTILDGKLMLVRITDTDKNKDLQVEQATIDAMKAASKTRE